MTNRQRTIVIAIVACAAYMALLLGIDQLRAQQALDAAAAGEALPVDAEPAPEEEPELKQDAEQEPEEETEAPVIALTFDDGPSPEITPALIDELAARRVKASFFVLGKLAEEYPEIIEQMYAAGNEVDIHGWDHQHRLPTLSDGELEAEIFNSRRAVYQATGADPPYLRPPYGAIDKVTAEKIKLPMMLWNLDPRDWELRDAEKLKEYLVEHAFDGAVVILHDQYQPTLEGTLAAVDELLEQGYRFVTLEEYYQHFGIQPEPGQVYRGTLTATLE